MKKDIAEEGYSIKLFRAHSVAEAQDLGDPVSDHLLDNLALWRNSRKRPYFWNSDLEI